MRNLSTFQLRTLEELQAALAAVGRRMVELRTCGEGDEERYLTGRIEASPVEVWIYEDEAVFISEGGVDRRFETPDFKSSEDLMRTFIAKVLEFVTRP